MSAREPATVWDALVQRQLKKLPPATTLSLAQLERIARSLDHTPRSRGAFRLLLVALAGATVIVAAIFASLRHQSANRLIVPKGAIVRLSTSDGARLALTGSAEVERLDSSVPRLREGRIVLQTQKSPLVVEVPDGLVRVRPSSFVAIEVLAARARVAAYVGSADVEWRSFGSAVTVGTGTRLSMSGVERISDGEFGEAKAVLYERTENPPAVAVPPSGVGPALRASPPRPRREAVRSAIEPSTATIARADEPSEADVVAIAIRQLNGGAPAEALATLDGYWMRHPGGELAPEAETIAVEALLQLHRSANALTRLDAMNLDGKPNGARLAITRGELRAEAGRCTEAIGDFALAMIDGDAALSGRALYDRGVCRARLGDTDGARRDFADYVVAQPHGPFAEAARRALGNRR